ncbi:MAG: hypothetical protein ACJ8CR_10985 [Roseiflexaceae bacterium]
MRPSIPTLIQHQRQMPYSFAFPAPTDVRTLRAVFGLWILAYAFKHAGASWDLSWHFRFLRDDLIPPHMTNLVGNCIAAALLFFQYRTGIAIERRGFLVLLTGFALFVVSIPLDLINHRLFGLDATIWSPPHLMLFSGSTVGLVGLLWMWQRLAAPGPWKTAYTFVFLTMLMDCMIFVLGQHEYGVLSIDAYMRGQSTASAELLAVARDNVVRFATGPMPTWIYPVWMVLTSTAVLLVARMVQPGRWTATIVATLYLAYRAVVYVILLATAFPPSFIPVMLVVAALAIDLAARWQWRPVVATGALLVAFYGAAALVGRLMLMPDFAPVTALFVAVPLWAFYIISNSQTSRSAAPAWPQPPI